MTRTEALLTLTLRDGTRYEWNAADLPKSIRSRTWKSWAMRQLPYGTDFFGCRWGIERREPIAIGGWLQINTDGTLAAAGEPDSKVR